MHYVSESFKATPLVTSAPLTWPGLRVEQYHLGAMTLPAHYHRHHLLMLYQVDTPLVVQRHNGARVQQEVYQTGDLGIYPGGEYGNITWAAASRNTYLTVDDDYLERLARQGLDLAYFSLQERVKLTDPLLAQLGRQLLTVASAPPALGSLYTESLIHALCYHLIEHYGHYERRPAPAGKLPAAVLARIDAYLEDHLGDAITLEILADLAHLSVFHFARLFKQTTGLAPYHYVLRRKIARAQQLLRLGGTSVTHVSEVLGFASAASFSAAFRRATGQGPQAFQRAQGA
ncbi:helix-turn-helix transcriptional regulator [Hymenobacter sp. BT559]|uniref:helix-turn-helix transcriptional regulator n=1 Tax=Hymenobacter sp. BT559 TaxID=2795729 RepID=UPI0018ED5D5F|nr:AraC family transcriptional regulator [Hymenobacter sp. BT559]MBJ6145324.1 helix-turn-helix transcriptional regulator [Hymenobacter sp. BT559]